MGLPRTNSEQVYPYKYDCFSVSPGGLLLLLIKLKIRIVTGLRQLN